MLFQQYKANLIQIKTAHLSFSLPNHQLGQTHKINYYNKELKKNFIFKLYNGN